MHSPIVAPYVLYYSLNGRFGRLHYLNSIWEIALLALPFLFSGLLIIMAFTFSFAEALIFLSGLLLPFLLLLLRVIILRLHDLNRSAWWLIGLFLFFIPTIGIYIGGMMLLLLAVSPGSSVINCYGAPSKKGSLMGLLLAILTISFAVYLLTLFIGEEDIQLGFTIFFSKIQGLF